MQLPLAFILTASAAGATVPKAISELSFGAPFHSVSSDGTRVVDDFQHTGHTEIHRHFVRLTPDRQSKSGALWSKTAPNINGDFSSILAFRISGQASKWYGDGLGWWFTKNTQESIDSLTGPLHGTRDKFIGFGVVFDTFENTDPGVIHNDLTIFSNNGTRSGEEMQQESFGCRNLPSKVRYHEKRADFSWSSKSQAAISMTSGRLSVWVDADNSGKWFECVKDKDLGIPQLAGAVRVGVSASTGGVADNHDVISMMTAAGSFTADSLREAARTNRLESNSENTAGISKSDTSGRISAVQHHFDHELVHLKESLGNAINKIKKAEEASEDWIEYLENKVRAMVLQETNNKLSGMVKKLQQQDLDSQQRINALERRLEAMVNTSISSHQQAQKQEVERRLSHAVLEAESKSSSWRTPFMLLVIALGGGSYGLWRHYNELRKSHLL